MFEKSKEIFIKFAKSLEIYEKFGILEKIERNARILKKTLKGNVEILIKFLENYTFVWLMRKFFLKCK